MHPKNKQMRKYLRICLLFSEKVRIFASTLD